MRYDLALRLVAVVLMLAGAVMLISGGTGVVPFAAVALGVALTVVLESVRRRHGSAQ
jgi:hypothetical protein